LVALFGVSGARVSPGCVSLGTEFFISLKNVQKISQVGRAETQMLPFIKHELAYFVRTTGPYQTVRPVTGPLRDGGCGRMDS
jgi:hypothetical protein